MKPALSIIALGAAGFAAGFFTRGNPVVAENAAAKAPGVRLDPALRSGDAKHAMESLRMLAEDDPRAFFKALDRFPRLEGIKGMVETAARKLAASDPAEAAKLLNEIANLDYRMAAWPAFLKALQGPTLVEKLAIGRLAKPTYESMLYQAVVQPSLEKDPEGTLQLLRQKETITAYGLALGEYGTTHSAQAIDKLKADMAGGLLKPSSAQWILKTMAVQSPGPEVLGNIAGMLKGYGWGEGLYAGPIFSETFEAVAPEGKAAVLDAVDGLLAVQKNFVLSQIPLADCPDADTALRVLNSLDSTELQIAALKKLEGSHAAPAMLAAVQAGITSARTRDLWQAQKGGRGP